MMCLYVFCARASKCKHSHDDTAVARKPRMWDNQYSLLGETVSIYYSSDYTCDHVYMCTYTQLQKKHFHVFLEFSVMSVHRNFFTGKKIKLLACFELASSVLGVLGLAHYTRADDIVIFLQL